MARTTTTTRLRELGAAPGPGRDEDGPVALPVFIMTSLLALIAVLALGVIFGTRTIEANMERNALEMLAAADQTELEVQASGLNLHVSGVVHEERLVERIPEFLAQNLVGVRQVTGDIRLVVIAEERDVIAASDPLVVTWSDGSVTVSGSVSDEATRTSIEDALGAVFTDIDVEQLVIDANVAPERDWLPTILTLVREVQEVVADGEILANPNASVVAVAAEFSTRQARSDARAEIEDILGALTFDFVSGLTLEEVEPPPPEERVIELQESLDDLIEGKVVEFEVNSAVITPAGQALLDEILDALVRFPDVPVEIGGHTDDRGGEEYNLDLSRRRAEAVLGYLAANGEQPERFVVIGYGESQPIADNSTAEGQARNRRIEFTALKE